MFSSTVLRSTLQHAKANPEQDYQLLRELDFLLSLENTKPEEYVEKIDDGIKNAKNESSIHLYLTHLRNWEQSEHTDFQDGIGAAIDEIDNILDEVLEYGWLNVATLFLREKITRPEQLGGHSGAEGVAHALKFLDQYLDEDRLQPQSEFQLANCIVAHDHHLSEDEKELIIDICLEIVTELKNCGRFPQARDLLVEVQSISEETGHRYHDIQDLFVQLVKELGENYDDYETKTLFLEHVVSNYGSLLTDEAEKQWKQSIKKSNKRVRENNKLDIQIDRDEIMTEVHQLLSAYKKSKDSTSYPTAFAALLLSNIGIVSSSNGGSVYSKDPRRMISPEGDRVALNDISSIPTEDYLTYTQISNLVLYEFLNLMFERRLVTESELYLLINTLPGADEDDKAYLTDIIISYFEGGYSELTHMAIPRFESLVVNAFREYGEPVTMTNIGGEFEQQTFGGLLSKFEEDIDENLGRYYRYRYTEKGGMNIRNRVCHGQTKYKLCSRQNATILLFDLLRAPVRIGNHYR